MKATFRILFLIFFISNFAYSQEKKPIDVYEAKEIIFFGYDFSHFKLNDASLLSDDRNIKKYIGAWIAFCQESLNEKTLPKKLGVENVVIDYEPTEKLIKKINNDEIVSLSLNRIPKDSLQDIINSYSITNKKDGIGMVVNIECFNKSNKRVYAYFTFFDIATRKIIFSDNFSSKEADGYGLSKYWGIGLSNTFKIYIADVYKKNRKKTLSGK